MKITNDEIQRLIALKKADSSVDVLRVLPEETFYNYKISFNDNSRIEYENIRLLLDSDLCTFKELIDHYKSLTYLWHFLSNEDIFKMLIDNKMFDDNDLNYLFSKFDEYFELIELNRNTTLIHYVIDNDLVSFEEFVDLYKKIKDSHLRPNLHGFFDHSESLKYLLQTNSVTADGLLHLLKVVDSSFEISSLCGNGQLMKNILNSFVLDEQTVDKLNTIIREFEYFKDMNVSNIFDLIEQSAYREEQELKQNLLSLTASNKYLHKLSFRPEERKILHKNILQFSETALNNLKQIVDNNLQDQYTFRQLFDILNKDHNKKRNKLNL